ncbi:carboxypeptidase regulatory-like domain-containing protein [Mesonia sp.]|uniref:carboxypeptidase regulatory-like domain-containing protein n=1 Tax=Mesonia sp. TaxID=1960830 RepID=UPI003F9C6F61
MKQITLLFLLLFSGSLVAQSIKISGSVKDSLGNPLELANIIANTTADGNLENYAITNPDGEYSFRVSAGAEYKLVASFLGLKPSEKTINIPEDSEDLSFDFTLFSNESELEGVELVYEMPVTIKGDTIVYNADSFTNGTERKLGDVLKKLPGVEVTDDGEIEVEGKKVGKVMVEGKDFFDGDSKLATKNIPADAVSKVEVLRNHNDVGQMRGLGNDQDNVAINIKLKEGKKNFWFGELEGGLGDGEKTRYLGAAKLFYYSPKTSINLIGNANNTGDVPFTFRDYFNFTGGFSNINQRGGTNFRINDSGLGFLITQNNRANEIETTFGAANFSQELQDDWDVSGFAIFSDNKTDFLQKSVRTYVRDGIEETTDDRSEQTNRLGMIKLSTVYKPNLNFQLDYDVLAKQSKQEEYSDVLSVFSNGAVVNPIEENKENDPFSINQNLNIYYTLNPKNIFAGYVQHLYQKEDPFYNALVQIQPFAGILPLENDPNGFDVNQQKTIESHKLDAKVDYYYVINKKSNLNLTLGSTLSHQNFDSSIFQRLSGGGQNDFTQEDLRNEVSYNFTDLFLGAHYKFKTGLFTFTPGVTLHHYRLKNQQNGIDDTNSKTLVLPDLFTIVELKKSENIRLDYQMTAEYTDVNNFAEGYVFNNYNRLFRGNRDLENAIYHTVNLSYFNFNMFNFTNIFGGINYSRKIDAIKTFTTFDQINQVSSPINSNFVDESLSGSGRFQKTFRKIKANLRATVSYSKLNSLISNGSEFENAESENFSQNYQASLESNFKIPLNFEIGYNRMINNYNNGGRDNTFYTDKPFVNAQVDFLKGFTFEADWSYYNYTNKANTVSNEYSFVGASLYYQQKDSSWEFRLNGTNLLDVESLNNDSFTENFNTTSQYFVQPRILMASVKYNL